LIPHIQSQGFVIEKLLWIQEVQSFFGFRLDSISLPLALLTTLIGILVAIYSIAYMKDEHNPTLYHIYILLFITGMLNVFLTIDLIIFYLFWEFMLIPSFFLISEWGTGKSTRIAIKYFIITHIGALFLLIGIIVLGINAGTTELTQLSRLILDGLVSEEALLISSVLMILGFAVKMAVFPLHIWLPDAHAEAPTPISILLSGVMVKTGGYGLLRIVLLISPNTLSTLSLPVLIVAVITMIYGGFMAIAQRDIKRLLAYSTISQMGYIAFGLAETSPLGILGSFFHIIFHGLSKSVLFMAAGIIMHRTGLRDLRELTGQGRRMPFTAFAFTISALTLAGIPPLGGFLSEWMIFTGGFSSGQYLLSTIAVLQSVLTITYYLLPLSRLFLYKASDIKLEKPSLLMILPMMLLTVVNLILPLFFGSIFNFLESTILSN
jgi:proton-translocating NADH-quinone oxidoreductase chain M